MNKSWDRQHKSQILSRAKLHTILLLPWVCRGCVGHHHKLIKFTGCSNFWQLKVWSALLVPVVSLMLGREREVRHQLSWLHNSWEASSSPKVLIRCFSLVSVFAILHCLLCSSWTNGTWKHRIMMQINCSQQGFWQETQLFHNLVYAQMLLFGIDVFHQQ